MPTPDLILNAALFAVAGMLLALVTVRLAPGRRKAMLSMTFVMAAGVVGLYLLAQSSDGMAGMTIMIMLRELALLALAIGIGLVLLAFLFQGLLAKAAVPRILADVLLVLLLIGYALYRMNVAGVNLAGIITTSAVITGVIAFSLQATLGNLWGGIALQLDNTCRMGDWIRVDGITGQIVGIRWRCLAVATNNGETVIIPNAQLINHQVTVLGRRGDLRIPLRRYVQFGVAYDVAPSRVIAVVEGALARAEIPYVAAEPAARCTCSEFGDQRITYGVLYWLTDPAYDLVTDSQVLAHVFATLSRHEMEIPLPQRVLLTPHSLASKRAVSAGRELAARLEVLAQLPLFATLTDGERTALAAEIHEMTYLAGDIVSREGDVSDSMYILARGDVAIFRGGTEQEPKRAYLAELSAPNYFGEMGLLTGAARTATIIARGDALCYRIERSGFDAILRARPEVVGSISQTVAEREAANTATLLALSEEARARQASGRAADLVRRIQTFFGLSG
jgi:small-conductance mechanosensitive channel/CRP-like cAMP-binding protein